MNNLLNGKSAAMMLALSLVNVTAAFAQDDNSSAKEEGNRNVMLNAASANGPREIQIGLPSADVNVLENGLPVTYATNPHSVNTIWRGDASLSHQALLKIAETAITTGNIGYAVNSFTQKGQKGFNGTLNYKSNHFGLQEFSLNMNGDLGKDWYYSFNMYQDFDPGTFKIKSTPYQDRTQIYKALLTKKYNGNRGEFTAMYKYANSHNVYNYATQSAPFIYVGDGSVKEYGDFKLGTTSYLPVMLLIVSPILKAGFTRMRSNPFSSSVYMPPIEVPMMRSGFSVSAIFCSISMPSSGCTGMSSATRVAFGISSCNIFTVPLCAEERKP